jgi:hypothetical protein
MFAGCILWVTFLRASKKGDKENVWDFEEGCLGSYLSNLPLQQFCPWKTLWHSSALFVLPRAVDKM